MNLELMKKIVDGAPEWGYRLFDIRRQPILFSEKRCSHAPMDKDKIQPYSFFVFSIL